MQKIFRQYNLTTELAQKYSHSTYLASATDEPERQVVLTVFASSLSRFPHERENLLKKAQRIKELEHPHLAPILDMGIEQEQPFVVREYRPNGSLRNCLKKLSSGHLELREALTIVSQVGQALVYAHERNIIHGNIKPENILLEADGQVTLTDFSLVERKDAIIRDQTSQEYAFCYLAPEQFSGTCDTRSDQYALGCLAYELITGRVPFAAQSLSSMMGHQSNELPAPLSQSVADLPASLEVAVLKTLANDPDERFFDFSLFLEVLQSVLSPPPAFPLLRSAYSGKNKTISHPIPSAKTENISSPIRKRATKRVASQSSKSSGASSRAEPERIESARAQALIEASIPLQRETTSATASPITALQSQPQTSSLSQDTNPLNVENVSLPHPLKGQTPSESSALMLETIPQAELLTVESAIVIPIIQQGPDDTWLIDPFVGEDALPARAATRSADRQSEVTTSKVASSLARNIHRRGPMSILALHSRRRVLELGLLLSIIMAVACSALWLSGILPFNTNSSLTDFASNNGGAKLSATSTTTLLQSPKSHLIALSTAIPIATANFSQNAAIANSNPHAENITSNLYGTYNSSRSNAANGSSNTNPASSGSNTNPPSSGSNTNPPSPSPTPTPTPTPTAANSDPYPPSGTLALDDPLSDNSRGYGWQETSSPDSNGGWACQFIGGAYHAIETTQNGFDSCHANLQASNFTLEVNMQIIQGSCGGIVLRDTMSQAHAYSFQVCQDGSYQLYRWDGFSSGTTLQSGSSGAIVTGLNQSNVIAAVANGSTFDLWVNNQEIITVTDSSYSQGQFGVTANGNTEAAYTNARMWTL